IERLGDFVPGFGGLSYLANLFLLKLFIPKHLAITSLASLLGGFPNYYLVCFINSTT
ncbi:hypothetical protein ACJX0J_017504, partial [Zea mays]